MKKAKTATVQTVALETPVSEPRTFVATSTTAKIQKHAKSGKTFTRHSAGAYGVTNLKVRTLENKLDLIVQLAQGGKGFATSRETRSAFNAFAVSYRSASHEGKTLFRSQLGAVLKSIPAYAPYIGEGETALDGIEYPRLAHQLFDLGADTLRQFAAHLGTMKKTRSK